MSGKEHDPVVSQSADDIAETDALLGIKACGRLIQQKDFRIIEQGLGNAQSPYHTAGEMFDLLLFFPGKSGQFQHFPVFSKRFIPGNCL